MIVDLFDMTGSAVLLGIPPTFSPNIPTDHVPRGNTIEASTLVPSRIATLLASLLSLGSFFKPTHLLHLMSKSHSHCCTTRCT